MMNRKDQRIQSGTDTTYHQRMEMKKAVWYRDSFTCVYCGLNMRSLWEQWCLKKIRRKKALISVDHLKPLSKGGDWSLENMVTACFKCNLIKGSKYYEITKPVPVKSKIAIFGLLAMLALWFKRTATRWFRNKSYHGKEQR